MKTMEDVAFWLLVVYVVVLIGAGLWFEWRKGRRVSDEIRATAMRANKAAQR